MKNSGSDDSAANQERILGVMAKYWTPGNVKTRLGQSVGMPISAKLHHLFVSHITEQLQKCGDRRELVGSPAESVHLFDAAIPDNWDVSRQSEGDLGERMCHWFNRQFDGAIPVQKPAGESGSSKLAILIGADCPTLSIDDLDHAFALLSVNDVILGPAADGGYYLVGINSRCPESARIMFDFMQWSMPTVLKCTLERIQLAELAYAELPLREDVDTITDLHSLRSRLHGQPELIELKKQIDAILSEVTQGQGRV